MLPKIWIFDSYSIMLFIGVIVCFIIFNVYAKKYKLNRNYTIDILLLASISIIVGLIFALLFQMLFDFIDSGKTRKFATTFYGGLCGGIIVFILGYYIFFRKKYSKISLLNDICPIAPACISIAHAFGRIGCFLAGCCYGKKTNSIFGVMFLDFDYKVHPVQLYEAIFLFILFLILFLLAYKRKSLFTIAIYLISYGIFRFFIEFLRGDYRGGTRLAISPSQVFSVIAIIVALIYAILIYKKNIKNKTSS